MTTPTGPAALAARRTVRRRVLSLAPWAVALLLAALGVTRFALGTGTALAEQQAGVATAPSTAPRPLDTIVPTATPTGQGTPAPDATSPQADSPTLPPALTASVLAAARTALGTDGLGTSVRIGDAPLRWALDLAVVEVTSAAPDRLVVIVHGTVITSAVGEGWSTPSPAAVAVAVATAGMPTVGPTWPLTAPTAALAPQGAIGGSPVDDVLVHEEVLAALLDAGWSPDAVTALHALQDGLLIAHVEGVAPDGTSGPRGVWLTRTADGLRVAGHARTPTTSLPPTSTPDPDPDPDPDPSPPDSTATPKPQQHPTAHTTETT